MKFEHLKRELKNNVHNHYLLFGDDAFLLSRAYSMILEAYNIQYKDLNKHTFNDDIILCSDVVKALETLPMLSDKRLVYINISNGTKLIDQHLLTEYLKKPAQTSALIINIGSTKILTIDTACFEQVDCNRVGKSLFNKFIANEFAKNNKKITTSALELLYTHTNGYLKNAINEVIKLSNYVALSDTITIEHIQENVSGNLEFKIYELTESLARKNSKKVFLILDSIKSKRESQIGLLTLIYNHFRRLLHIALNAKLSDLDLSKLFGIKQFAVQKLRGQVHMFSPRSLKKICDLCALLEYKVKSGTMQQAIAINILVLNILNE